MSANEAKPPPFAMPRGNEFPAGAHLPPEGLSRRRFLRIMGASLALAGSSGCFRKPREQILTYVEQPEELVGSDTLAYATTLNWRGYARGIVATSYQGRPIKLDGNPDHPSTFGASDPLMQAAVLDLYEQNRLRAPRHHGRQSSWRTFREELTTQLQGRRNQAGRGLWIIAEANTSPTEHELWQQLARTYPRARIVFHRPAAELRFPPFDYRFENADVILGIGLDFLGEHPESLRYSRDFAMRRRGWKDDGQSLSRFFSLHAAPNITTTMADVPCVLDAREWPAVLEAIEESIRNSDTPTPELPEAGRPWIESLLQSLRDSPGRSLIIAGSTQPAPVHAWTARLNALLGNLSRTVHPIDPPASSNDAIPSESRASLEEFAEALNARAVSTLLVLDSNPAFTAPRLRLAEAIGRAEWSAAGSTAPNETASLCDWQLPLHHFLEDWGDLRSFTGEVSPVQPLIHPLFTSHSRLELLNWLSTPRSQTTAHQLLQAYWRSQYSEEDFPQKWRQALSRGIFPDTSLSSGTAAHRTGDPSNLRAALGADEPDLALELRLDPTIEDGRHARNAWLQELPKPLSKLVWDNALWVAPELVESHGWKTGEILEVVSGDVSATLPVFPMPGMAPGTVVAHLGYGRPLAALHDDQQTGFNAFALWSVRASWHRRSVTLRSTGKYHELVSVQHHWEMEEHDFVHIREPGAPTNHHAQPESAHASFYPTPPDLPGAPSPYQWGMSIDLSSCTGCSACVVACQAENNIPAVGKEQVARGRELHWLHIDQYFDYSRSAPHVLHQPRLCMHCEKAPCEVVCPVAATVHDREGLNVMVYNRCIGTRYCSNNCPYKVRCFNFLDYRPAPDDPRNLQFNPDVTVRERGVMEKCTFCVQRISHARIQAKSTNSDIPPNSVRTACQQACPTAAIVFGNTADAQWDVVGRKQSEGDYALLGELDTRPRVSYLPKWRNPAP